MCELLDEPVKSSDSKKRQIEEWQLFCNIDISKNPTRYNVLDVYEGKIELLKEHKEWYCEKCGSYNNPWPQNAKYCRNCGEKLN